MKLLKTLLCLLTFAMLSFHAFAALSLPALKIADQGKANLATPEQLKIAQMKWFANLTVTDYEKLTGKKLNFFSKMSFKLSQHRMQKKLQRYEYGESNTLSKISWFCKGLLLGPIAVALAYIFLPEEDSDLIKWAWFGFAGFAVIVCILIFAV